MGYIHIFLANESDAAVWFDELSITHIESPVVQENHYDPWGLNLAGIETQGQPDHKFQYNGKEKVEDFNLGWYEYGFRCYMPDVARFTSVDPLATSFPELTTYQYASNRPINSIDLEGLEAKISIYGAGVSQNRSDQGVFKSEAMRDVRQGLATKALDVFTTDKLVQVLENLTTQEGSIGYVSFFTHGTQNGVILDNGEYGREALTAAGSDWPKYGYNNNIGIDEITGNPNITFDKGALVVFGGCNICKTEIRATGEKITPFAFSFTDRTGVASIAADGYTSPNKKGNRQADYNYYLIEKTGDNKIMKTALGKELTQSLIRDVADYMNSKKNVVEPIKPVGINGQ